MHKDFQQLIDWSLDEYSSLPWRQNRTLYTTLVSEIMLQQTTVGTVLPKFSEFLKKFPTIESLAQSTEDQLRTAWQGLGYYRRATNLLKAAQFLAQVDFPTEEDELEKVNGIGPYTASALRAIGHDLPALAVDGNLKRVLSRYFEIYTPYEKGLDKDIRQLLERKQFLTTVTQLGPRKLNEALMDLGRVICRVKSPLCLTCPLKQNCQAFKNNTQEKLPVRTKKAVKLIDLHLLRFICINQNNEILLYKKRAKEWLTDQWELPTAAINPDEDFKQYPTVTSKIPSSDALKTGITKYRIYNYAVREDKDAILLQVPEFNNRELAFYKLEELPHISTATTKILKRQELI
jgi:A/G-specific adenine glycosylase